MNDVIILKNKKGNPTRISVNGNELKGVINWSIRTNANDNGNDVELILKLSVADLNIFTI